MASLIDRPVYRTMTRSAIAALAGLAAISLAGCSNPPVEVSTMKSKVSLSEVDDDKYAIAEACEEILGDPSELAEGIYGQETPQAWTGKVAEGELPDGKPALVFCVAVAPGVDFWTAPSSTANVQFHFRHLVEGIAEDSHGPSAEAGDNLFVLSGIYPDGAVTQEQAKTLQKYTDEAAKRITW